MQVEMWADIVCSWCGVANRRVQAAIAGFAHADEIVLTHRSFRLLSDQPEGTSYTFGEYFRQLGMTETQTRDAAGQVEGTAFADGIAEYHVADNRIGNTTLAHEFLAFATEQGVHAEAWDLLFDEHFTRCADLWDIDDLVVFAVMLGLSSEKAREVLSTRRFRDRVVAEHDEVLSYGVSGVPFLVIDRRFGLSGAQPVTTIRSALERAWETREA